MKAIKQVLRQDKEPYHIPKRVQDVIPIKRKMMPSYVMNSGSSSGSEMSR